MQRILNDRSETRVETATTAAASSHRICCSLPGSGGGGLARSILAVFAAAFVGARDAAIEALTVPLEAGGFAAAAARAMDERGAALGCASIRGHLHLCA